MVEILEKNFILHELKSLTGWQISMDGKGLEQTFLFENFIEAFSFITSVALEAEKTQHHPEWSNVYNRVEMKLTTHECNGISSKDLHLAKFVNSIFYRGS